MSDTGPQCQGPRSPPAQNIDLSCASELCVPGSFPVPTIRGHTSALETSLPADHGDGVVEIDPLVRHIILALDKVRNELSNTWSSLSKFAHEERNTPMATVVIM